jgi:hypothetical protein
MFCWEYCNLIKANKQTGKIYRSSIFAPWPIDTRKRRPNLLTEHIIYHSATNHHKLLAIPRAAKSKGKIQVMEATCTLMNNGLTSCGHALQKHTLQQSLKVKKQKQH